MNIATEDVYVSLLFKLFKVVYETWFTKIVDQIIELSDLPSDTFLKTVSIVVMVIPVCLQLQ